MDPKNWYVSKMVWFNVITTILGLVPVGAVFMKTMQPELAIRIDAVVALVNGIGNVILRVYFTDTPIASKAASQ